PMRRFSPFTYTTLFRSLNLQAVTKSNGFTGPGIGINYTNQNLFKGGERLSIDGNFSYEKQFHKGDGVGSSSISGGLKASLLFPRDRKSTRLNSSHVSI